MFKRLLLATSLLTNLLSSFTNAAPITSQIARTEGCTSIINNNKNYLFCQTPKSWLNAQTFCAMSGGDLLSIRNVEESEWIKQQRNETNTLATDAWITLETNNFVFWSWNIMSPTGVQNTNCARVLAISNVIEDMSCNVLLNFICERPYRSTLTTTDHTHMTTSTPDLPYYTNSAYYEPMFIIFGLLIIMLIIIRVQMRDKYIYTRRVDDMPQTTVPPTLPPVQLMENPYMRVKPEYVNQDYAINTNVKPNSEDVPDYSVPGYSVPAYSVPDYSETTTDTGNYSYLDVIVLPTATMPMSQATMHQATMPQATMPMPESRIGSYTYMR